MNSTETHILIALRRRKDNPDGKVMCFRHVCTPMGDNMGMIEKKIANISGNWRIHKTVNPRNTEIATRMLMKAIIDDPNLHNTLISKYTSFLLSKKCRKGRKLLIDIDDPDTEHLHSIMAQVGTQCDSHEYYVVRTPNGYHIVVDAVINTQGLVDIPNVTLLRDGYVFRKKVTVL